MISPNRAGGVFLVNRLAECPASLHFPESIQEVATEMGQLLPTFWQLLIGI